LLVLEGEVFSPGSSHCGLIHRHNSSVGVSHETTIGNSGGSTGIDSAIDSLGEEVVSAGSSNSRSVNRHNSSVRVGNKASKGGRGGSVGNRGSSNSRGSSIGNSWGRSNSGSSSIGNSWGSSNNGSLSSIDSSLSGEVISTGSSNSRLINRGDSTIGVSNQLGVEVQGSRVAIGRGIGSWGSSIGGNSGGSSIGNSWGSSNNGSLSSIGSTLGGKVISTGSSNSRLINGGESTVGVSNQLGVEVQGSRVAIGRGIGSWGSSIGGNSCGSSIGNSWGSSISGNSWGSSNNRCLSSIGGSLSIKVISTCSSNSRLINRNNSSVRVSNQLAVEVERSSVTIGRGISSWSSSISGKSWGSSIGGNSWGSSSIAEWAGNRQSCSSIEFSLGSKVLSLGSGDSWLIHGGDGSVGVANQPVETLGGDAGQGSSKNQKLHDETC